MDKNACPPGEALRPLFMSSPPEQFHEPCESDRHGPLYLDEIGDVRCAVCGKDLAA